MLIEVSDGELLDKYSILEIKRELIKDENKLVQIIKELQSLNEAVNLKNENVYFYNILKYINKKIWSYTDEIKSLHYTNDNYSKISSIIFDLNQDRFRVKNILNKKSNIKEQKSYSDSFINFNIMDKIDIEKVFYLSVKYDVLNLYIKEELIDTLKNIFVNLNINYTQEKYDLNIEDIQYENYDKNIFTLPTISYLSSGSFGDFIHQLSIIYEIFLKTGKKGILYLTEKDERFLNGVYNTYNDVYNLIKSLEYIEDFLIWNGEIIDINLSEWRYNSLLYKANWFNIFNSQYNINSWGKHKWISIKNEPKEVVLINCSNFRNNIVLNWDFLKSIVDKYETFFICNNLTQYENFKKNIYQNNNIKLLFVKNLDEMIEYIHNCKFFIGNLSAPLAIAYACHKKCYTILSSACIDDNHQLGLNNHLPFINFFQNYNNYSIHPDALIEIIE
jgi:hypothetical protein